MATQAAQTEEAFPEEEEASPKSRGAGGPARKSAPASSQAPPPPAAPPSPPVFLTRRGNTRVSIQYTEEPWSLPVDAFVIPSGPEADLSGGLAEAWLRFLGNEGSVFRAALQQAQAQRRLEPDSPLLVPLPEVISARVSSRHVILATAFAPQPSVPAAGIAAAAIVRLAAENKLRRIAVALLGSGWGQMDSAQVADVMLRGVFDALPDHDLDEITLTTLSEEAIEAARNLWSRRGPTISNDLSQGEDLLNIADEVNALAEGLMLRELNPPLVVGVLGGWGSGKSFVMDLMHRKMAEIRSQPLPEPAPDAPEFPYVGHVYLIKFDAWTYAKSNLWASLMQKVFYDLNRQLTLEKRLREAGLDERFGEQVWKLLYDLPEREQQQLLDDPEDLKALQREWKKQQQKSEESEVTEDLLWSTLRDVKQAERETLDKIETKLAEKRGELEVRQEALERGVDDEIARAARRAAWKPLEKVLRDLLGKSYASILQQVNATAQPFRVDDFRDPAALAKKLKARSDPVSEHLWSRFPDDKKPALDEQPAPGAAAPGRLAAALAEAFNQRLNENDLYEKERFSKVELSPDTRELLELLREKPGNTSRSGLNRLLLEDAYPQEIAKSPRGDLLRLQEITPNLQSLIKLGLRNWMEIVAFLLFLAATIGLPWVQTHLEAYRLPGGILAFVSLIVAAARGLEKWRRLIAERRADYEKQVQEERERLVAERPRRLQQKREAEAAEGDAGVPALEMEVQKLEAQAKRQRQRVGLTADSVSLADFVTSRLNAAFYENQLGLMHQVQRDLAELAGGLTAREDLPDAEPRAETVAAAPQDSAAAAATREKLFPRGPARIVLFIDDLDRCPPATVVQVLEATQLLVKTPLFVVVLAMDVRFITRALEKSYASILTRRGKPSGLDYIEKIIQLPYQVRPIEPGGLTRYLNAQMLRPANPATPAGQRRPPPPAADGNGGLPDGNGGASSPPPAVPKPPAGILPTNVLEFSQPEFDFMKRCCENIDLTPRAVKRLVNVYKLLKIIWFRPPRRKPDPDVEQAVVLLLALSGRYPDLMRDVLEFIKEEREQKSDARFKDLFRKFQPVWKDVYTQREWRRLLKDADTLLPEGLTLKQMDAANFDLIHSFSFVGDIGYEPRDFATAAQHEDGGGEEEPSYGAAGQSSR